MDFLSPRFYDLAIEVIRSARSTERAEAAAPMNPVRRLDLRDIVSRGPRPLSGSRTLVAHHPGVPWRWGRAAMTFTTAEEVQGMLGLFGLARQAMVGVVERVPMTVLEDPISDLRCRGRGCDRLDAHTGGAR